MKIKDKIIMKIMQQIIESFFFILLFSYNIRENPCEEKCVGGCLYIIISFGV